MLKRALLLLVAVAVLATGCSSSSAPSVFTGRFAPMAEGKTGTLEGTVTEMSDLYSAVVTVRESNTGAVRKLRLFGDASTRSFRMTDLPEGNYEVYAEVVAKPDLPAPPADRVVLEPIVGYTFEVTPYAMRHDVSFRFRGEPDDEGNTFPRSFLWGDIYGVPSGYDVILTLQSPSYLYRRRIGGGLAGRRKWTLEELPIDDYVAHYQLYHRRGAGFAPPGRFVPESEHAVPRPGYPQDRLKTRWIPVDPGDNPGRITGTVKDAPSELTTIIVAMRDGMSWKAYGPRFSLGSLPPGAYVVSVRLWDPSKELYIENGMTDPPSRQVLVKPGATVENVNFRWMPDAY